MIFFLSKIIGYLINPFNMIVIFIIIGFFSNLIRNNFLSKIFYILALFMFFISAVLPTGSYLNFLLEKKFHFLNKYPDSVDGILILSGATNTFLTREHNQVNLNDSVERLTESILLIKRYPNAKVIFSGGSGVLEYPELDHASVAKRFFQNMGIDSNKLNYENKSRNTYENILFSKKLVNPKKNEKWLLVTSAIHLSRAMNVAEKLEWSFIPYPTDFHSSKNFGFSSFYKLQFFHNINAFNSASHEWFGLIAYYLMGRSSKILY